MKNRGITLLFMLVLMTVLAGCVVHRDIDEMNFVLGAAFDYNTQTKQYEVHVQVPMAENFAKGAGGGSQSQRSYMIFTGKGETVFNAIRDIAKGSSLLFWGHCDVFVVSQGLAEKGIFALMDFLSRDNEIREDAFLLVSQDPLRELLTIQGGKEKVPFISLPLLLDDALDVHGEGVRVLIREVVNELLKPQSSFVVSLVDIQKQDLPIKEDPKKFNLAGAAIFQGERMVGTLSPEETWGYNLIQNQLSDTLVTFDFQGQKLAVEQTNSKAKLKTSFSEEGVSFVLEVTTQGNIGNVENPLNLENSDTIQHIERAYEQRVTEKLGQTLQRAQEQQVDFLGLGRAVEKANPKYWAQVEKTWQSEVFPDLPVQIQVDGTIIRTGLTITTKPRGQYAEGS